MTWQDNLLATLAEQRAKKTQGRRHGWGFTLRVSREFLILVNEATDLVNWGKTTYIRRAVAAQMSWDLDIDVHRLLLHAPTESHKGEHRRFIAGHDTGEGIEQFRPRPCDPECVYR